MKRILAFLLIVVVSIGVMAWTSPELVKSIRLGLDLKGGFEILYEAEPLEQGGTVTKESLHQTAKSLAKRADALGTTEPEITPEGTKRIRVKIAGITDEAKVRDIMKKPAELTFRSADGCKPEEGYCKVELRGNEFVENGAELVYDQLHNPEVAIKVKDKKKWEEISSRLIGKQLAIYLDDRLLSDPVVNGVFTDGNAVISGSYTNEEARELRDTINLGALPLKLTEKYTQSVGATLGQMSLQQTVFAGLIGSAAVVLFMLIFYRLPGTIAIFTLLMHTWLMLLLFYWGGFTLTLPGIAAFVLGVGMAVDANIITSERIKEELRSGKSVLSALKAGSKNSFRAIMDANVTTLIAGAVMFMIGTGSVKGFAVILMLNIITSILTNVFLSRVLLHMVVKANLFKKPSYFGVKESEISAL
ncbi:MULTISPECIES: protein translocase subunit SecD [unclassified Paenibacillus]|uniref:protein translocase subunit SecD n=1 Tax=unclassified Paenibacillus TaxID=185978 RepID=UPI001C0FE540|nr:MULTISPECIES: protein translocase subunit SecD [unclassified Paenibacillus]MBU5442642.1 protein translocase subunit SecD [Paenibacillus sp. MSJ-34]CAH0119095.1 Protein translocase subunit SecDF [Paenibacillus sp. CECT 9249]